MPRVHHRKAAKDYPDAGVNKGDMYYTWKLKTGPASGCTYRQKTRPKPSQLTTSEYLGQVYSFEERSAGIDASDVGSAVSELEDIHSDVETLGEETREKFDNMQSETPNFAEGPTAELLESRADACDEMVSVLDTAIDEIRDLQINDDEADSETPAGDERQDDAEEDSDDDTPLEEKVQTVLDDISWDWG